MRAPEFPHDVRWLHLNGAPPPSMKDMRGKKVVLVDFWTYSCVNCIRTLPHLKRWHETYALSGLVIVGVHTPEFEFEKDLSNIQAAIKRFEIPYPVVVDSDYQVWSLYSNHVWPRKFLMDKDGQMIYNRAGEGGHRETEEHIRKALLDLDPEAKLPPPVETEDGGGGGVCLPVTGEIYLGAMRGHPGRVWRAEGDWKAHSEHIEHMRKTEQYEDYLALRFEASEVNLVMEAKTERPAKLRLELDGKPLGEIDVQAPQMYNLFKEDAHPSPFGTKGEGSHGAFPKRELKIFVKDAGVRMYAFTFGGCSG